MQFFKTMTTGIDKSTFKGIGYLLYTSIKKQLALWIFIALISIAMFYGIFSVIGGMKKGWNSAYETSLLVKTIAMLLTLMPIFLISVFSIPSTLNSLQRSTLIKRIGSTRLNEQGFIVIVWVWYFIISMTVMTAIFILMVMFVALIDTSNAGLISNWLWTYIFSIFVVMMFVSAGVLLGVLPVSQGFVIAISVVLFIFSILFGGILSPLTDTIGIFIPGFTTVAILVNPFAFTPYIMHSIFFGNGNGMLTMISIIYTLTLALTFFFLAAKFMTFNKIR